MVRVNYKRNTNGTFRIIKITVEQEGLTNCFFTEGKDFEAEDFHTIGGLMMGVTDVLEDKNENIVTNYSLERVM